MLKGANRIQWRIRFLETTEVSATDLPLSRKFPDFFKVNSQNRIKTGQHGSIGISKLSTKIYAKLEF